MTVPPPPLTSSPSPNHGYGQPYKPEAICWHICEGSGAGSLSWLTSPASGASSNYLVMESGAIHVLVDPQAGQDGAAWANGAVNRPDMQNPLVASWVVAGVNPNLRTISIEAAGYTSYGRGGSLSRSQVASLRWLTAWLCQEFAIACDRTHVIRHAQIDSVNRANCPGYNERTEMLPWIAEAAAMMAADGPPPDAGGEGVRWRITPTGAAELVINFGGEVTAILGVNIQDVGLTGIGMDGATYSRSVQANAFQPWVRNP